MWLRMLVSQVVKQAAEDQVRKLLTEGPREAVGSIGETRTLEPEELVSDALIVFGSSSEAGGWIDSQEGATVWPVDQGRLIKSSVGTVSCLAWVPPVTASEEAFRQIVEWVKPRLVLLAGFAVGLAPDLPRGTLVIGQQLTVEQAAGGQAEVLESPLTFDAAGEGSKGLRLGRLVSVNSPPEAGTARKRLHEQTQALAADPDAYEWAKQAESLGYPWIAVRVVTEAWDQLPSLQLKTLLEQGSLTGKIGAAVGSLIQEPKSAGELWRIQEDAMQASDRLARFLKSFVAGLA